MLASLTTGLFSELDVVRDPDTIRGDPRHRIDAGAVPAAVGGGDEANHESSRLQLADDSGSRHPLAEEFRFFPPGRPGDGTLVAENETPDDDRIVRNHHQCPVPPNQPPDRDQPGCDGNEEASGQNQERVGHMRNRVTFKSQYLLIYNTRGV